MRSEIGYCVCELFHRRWLWTREGHHLFFVGDCFNAHVEPYWRHRLQIALA